MSSELPHSSPYHPPTTHIRTRLRFLRRSGRSGFSRRAYFLVPLLCLLFGPAAHVQGVCVPSQFMVNTLSGKVVSQVRAGETPIDQASVELLEDRYQGRVIARTISAPDGTFGFKKKIKEGEYVLRVSYPNLATFHGPVKLMKSVSGTSSKEIVVTMGADFTKPCGGTSAAAVTAPAKRPESGSTVSKPELALLKVPSKNTQVVSLCELVSNWKDFDRQKVRVNSTLHVGGDQTWLYDPTCRSGAALTDVDFRADRLEQILNRYQEARVILEGTFYGPEFYQNVNSNLPARIRKRREKSPRPDGHVDSFDTMIKVSKIVEATPKLTGRPDERPQKVPLGFSYPETEETLLNFVIESKSLSGAINGTDGRPLADVLVEILNPNWQERIAAEFTDTKGRFAFEPGYTGITFLKLSKPGFSTMLLKVNVSEQATEDLEIKLHLGR